MIPKDEADKNRLEKLKPYIEYGSVVIIVSWYEGGSFYSYTQFEGDNRSEEAELFYRKLVLLSGSLKDQPIPKGIRQMIERLRWL